MGDNIEIIDAVAIDQESIENKFDSKEISAILNMLNGKPDSTVRIFPKDIEVDIGSLYTLRDKIEEKLSQYNLTWSATSVSIKFNNNTFKEFKDWAEFSSLNKNSSHCIENITLKWDFYIKFEGYEVPQRHTIVVRISSGLKPEQILQMLLTGQLENIDSIDKNVVPVVCKVDFINHLLGDEIINIVDEWNKGIQVQEQHGKILSFMMKNKRKIANFIKFIIPTIILIMLMFSFTSKLKSFNIDVITQLTINNVNEIVYLCAILIIIYNISKNFGYKIGKKVMDALYEFDNIHVFNITNGDKKKIEGFKKKNIEYKQIIKNNIVLTIIINVVCGLISSLLYSNIIKL